MYYKEIGSDELKTIHVDMLIEIDRYCNDNGLQYFLAYGTLLGAVRHQGFIPWDDDIDIIMPRSDYQKFINDFNSKTHLRELQVINYNVQSDYYLPFAKVIHTRTEVAENINSSFRLGVYIDIFPLDHLSDNIEKAKNEFNSLSIYRNLLTLKNLKPRKGRSFIKNGIVALGSTALKLLPISFLTSTIDKKARRYEGGKCTRYVANSVLGVYGEREIMPALWFKSAANMVFEGYSFSVPQEYHNILTQLYGDYMKLPPIEKRITHHAFKAWWKEDNKN